MASIRLFSIVSFQLLLCLRVATQALRITAPGLPPDHASKIIDQSFLGFAVESSSFPLFNSTFSQNLFNVFHNKTSAPVIFRVGGTSMDHSIFDINQEADWSFPNGREDNLQSNITFGKHWFKGFKTLKNIKFILDIPLARCNLTNAIKFTEKCLAEMGTINKLEALEIGNEVDVYDDQGWRHKKTWSPRLYARELKGYMDTVTAKVQMFPKTGRIFQIYDKGTEIDLKTKPRWTIDNFMSNVSRVIDMSRVKQVAEHYYQARGSKSTLQNGLLNHDHTVNLTSSQFKPEISSIRQKYKELKFVLSEVGNTLGSSGDKIKDAQLSSSLGSAVWTVDWMLYAMSLNIDRINMQMGRDFPFAAWNPNSTRASPPHLLGGFYGHVFVADFIGREGKLRVAQLPQQPPRNKNISAYAGYHNGRLAKVAVANQEYWTDEMGTRRPRTSVRVTLQGADVRKATVRKLWGPSSTALKNITWAGQDWPYDGANGPGMPVDVRSDTEVVPVENGAVNISLEATTVVLLSW